MSFDCPHCGEDLGEETCPACQRSLPPGSQYCYRCGEALASEAEVHEDSEPSTREADGAIDLESRVLCSDGTCIGVIGPDGHCKECGKPYTGEPEED
jgi:hypothetical protein